MKKELLTYSDILLMVENDIREGICNAIHPLPLLLMDKHCDLPTTFQFIKYFNSRSLDVYGNIN